LPYDGTIITISRAVREPAFPAIIEALRE